MEVDEWNDLNPETDLDFHNIQLRELDVFEAVRSPYYSSVPLETRSQAHGVVRCGCKLVLPLRQILLFLSHLRVRGDCAVRSIQYGDPYHTHTHSPNGRRRISTMAGLIWRTAFIGPVSGRFDAVVVNRQRKCWTGTTITTTFTPWCSMEHSGIRGNRT